MRIVIDGETTIVTAGKKPTDAESILSAHGYDPDSTDYEVQNDVHEQVRTLEERIEELESS